ncbi:MAG: DNA replication/repair protein RecF [Pseudomonadota bacterium]|jgi:DNA replication and repair protein RecF
MTLAKLEIDDFRCLERVRLAFDARYNLFVGENASGKTSLLEALFFLGRGRSFRTRRLDRLIRQGQEGFRLVGWVDQGGLQTVLGVGGRRQGTEIRVGGAPASSAAALAHFFPPQIIDPEVHKLLEEGPQRRRRFLDWGVFHVEHSFMEVWQRYHRALRQRNAALRLPAAPPSASVWDLELLDSGAKLDALRRRYLEALAEPLRQMGGALLGADVRATYAPGWAQEDDFPVALEKSRERDSKLGLTHVGPHRADITIRVDGLVAKERVSRGQQKLLAAALILAQLSVQELKHPGRGALLLDDPAAELDGTRLAALLAIVRGLSSQLFVTSLRPDLAALGDPGAMFHVERGKVTPACG